MPKSYPDFPRHDHIARYFDDYVDHFGFRDRIRFGVGVDHVAAARRRALRDPHDRGRDRDLRRGHRRQRPPLGPALAGAAVPRQRHLRGRADALPLLQGGDPGRRQGRRRPRHGQLGDGHRRRRLLPRQEHLPLGPPRRLHHPQVHVRQAGRPDRRGGVAAGLDPVPADGAAAQVQRRPDGELRAPGAGPQVRPRAPDDQRADPRPARPRRDHAEAEHRRAGGRQGPLHRRHRGPRRPRRLLHGLQDHVPVLRRGLRRREGQRAAALQVHVPPRAREPVLPRARPAARGDHADRRAPVDPDRRGAARPFRAALAARRWRPTSPTSAGR